MPYRLSATLSAHSSDVRALASPNENLIISASRDATAICWRRPSPTSPFNQDLVLKAGTRYVNATAYLEPSSDAPQGYAITGGQETVVNVFSLETQKKDPDFSLIGHSENVCALATTKGGTIISGSWDKTAKVWKNFQLKYDLKGHQQSVWAVLAVDEEQFLTGSADNTIRMWQGPKTVHVFQGHTQAVRGLALLTDIGFASCSNDSEIRVWTLGGDPVYTLSGHTSFVYSLSVLPDGDIVSAGEDRTVRVWRDGECSQTIVHPSISVWAVSTMPNGDIVSGSSDGHVRVFSAAEDRWASSGDLKEYEDQVASTALPAQQVGDINKTDLPGLEALSNPGKKDGDVKMVKSGGNVEAHQWDAGEMKWLKIGDVVDAVGSGRKQIYNGKEYDYVFDVDIQDGVPPLKLPYNAAENPYEAAQRFLQANDLPTTYIDDVVNFIEKNTSGINIGTGGNEFVDPYTGASRYQANSSSRPTVHTQAYADPYTGASRYSGTGIAQTLAPTQNYMDPFTGASRYSGAGSTQPSILASMPSQAAASGIIPATAFLAFKQANVTAMQTKLQQFDDSLRREIASSSLALQHDEHRIIEDCFSSLSELVATPPKVPTSTLSSAHAETIMQVLDRWPQAQRFPVVDLSRLIAGFSPSAFSTPGLRERFVQSLFKAGNWNDSWITPLPKPRETNVLLVLRTLANLIQDETSIGDGTWVTQVFGGLNQVPYESLNKLHRVALASIYFNFSCVNLKVAVPPALRAQHLESISKILQSKTSDSETVYRALVALGNTIFAAKKHNSSLDSVQKESVLLLAQTMPVVFDEARIKNVSKEIEGLLL